MLPQNRYQVAEGRHFGELRDWVVKYMEAGFVPLGGIAVDTSPDQNGDPRTRYLQAMWEPPLQRIGPGTHP